jgi:hypothetical protein
MKEENIPYQIQIEYNRLIKKHSKQISNYNWFVEKNKDAGVKETLVMIQGTEKKLERLVKVHPTLDLPKFNPAKK